jgi:hypothetical protein
MGYTLCGTQPSRVKVVWPTWAFRPGAKLGNPPIPHSHAAHRPNLADWRRVAGGGGARELALEVGALIWGIGSRGVTVAGSRR